jgi:hypothetical protein
MPPRKNQPKSKQTKSKSAGSKSKRKAVQNRRPAKAKAAGKRFQKKAARKKSTSARSSRRSRKSSINPVSEIERELQGKNVSGAVIVSGRRSPDFEGLSREEQADSESVDELTEEGNVFEAGAVQGVEEADNADEREVHTHEVPEDDVPEEYLDKE